MKKILYIVLVFSIQFGFSQNSDQLFSRANDLYKENKFSEALDLYLKIDSLGNPTTELYYNLGNTYYKLNKVAPTIYYYEKALKLNPLN